ncbi:transmembrane protein 79 [Esox lucius]|uniref:Transmembrane protein 79b n=1 Tax=Esox lucius TaxID=8010 RepID=A0A3P8Y170_ESOLU|nr:transmembrane protein 79 [Esox lucius]
MTGRQATNPEDGKEIDSVKESISDIINQLQDIDPARLSFSPFLDLDTQISLAPVSDSPESSVEELNSSSHSVTASHHSLEVLPTDELVPLDSCHQQPDEGFTEGKRPHKGEEGVQDGTISSPIATVLSLEDPMENLISTPNPDSLRDIPNGKGTERQSPEYNNLESTSEEGQPLLGLPPESIELTMWSSQDQETCGGVPGGADGERPCCYKCCQSGRVPAMCSVLASLVFSTGILYALYWYAPIDAPNCPDTGCRLTFTLCCCAIAAVPVLLAMLIAAMCQFCSGSLNPAEALPRRPVLQQLFVSASAEQLSLYVLNLLVLATLLPQDQLRVVPILTGIFVGGRLIYWFCLHMCSPWRGFGSGLTVFPLLVMVAFNLYCLYDLSLRQLLFGSDDALYNLTTPSSLSSSVTSDSVMPTYVLENQ